MRDSPSRLALLLVVLSGCTADTDDGAGPSAVAGPTELILREPVHHLDTLAREPMLAEHPAGLLFVSGYGSQVSGTDPNAPPHLWSSRDGGASWERVEVGTTEDGAAGNSDVDLAVAPDGALYFITMGFDRSMREGTHIAIGVSHDVGATWSWTRLSEDRFDDRPWVEVAPDGTAHAIWNDGSGVCHAVSTDGGQSWVERPRIHPQGGSSHLAVGPAGEVAVRITPLSASGNRYDEGVELIATSTDGGHTWQKHAAPGQRTWDPTFEDPGGVPRWVEPLAWDDEGALYHLWSEGRVVRLGRSADQGATWQGWQVAREAETAYFPYLAARGAGEVAATWFTGRGESLAVNVALLGVPASETEALRVLRAAPFQPDSWRESEDAPVRDPAGEYVPVALLSGGGLAVATTIQDAPRDRWGFSWWRLEAR